MKEAQLKAFVSDLQTEMFPGAAALIITGSASRGEMHEKSDLDVIVVYRKVLNPHYRAFVFKGRPIDANVHDFASLAKRIFDTDRRSGNPFYVWAVKTGLLMPEIPELKKLKSEAERIWKEGPFKLQDDRVNSAKVVLLRRMNQFQFERGFSERTVVASTVYDLISLLYLSGRGLWVPTSGLSVVRVLRRQAPEMVDRMELAFGAYWKTGDTKPVEALVQEVVAANGGPPVIDYREIIYDNAS